MSDQRSGTRDDQPAVTAAPARRVDPFAHSNLPQRPNYNPEEGEVGRSDFVHLGMSIVIAVVAIVAIGWVLSLLR